MDEEYKIVPCICCWYDLLGFGTPFIEANWDLEHHAAQGSINRIKNFHGRLTVGISSATRGTKLYMNDGIVASIDVEYKDNSLYEILVFMEALLQDYCAINCIDQRAGHPGVRGVITCGQRFCHDNMNMSEDVSSNRITSYYPKEFQMNAAFSKAFIIEGSGTRAGISGASLYFDEALISFFNRYFTKHEISITDTCSEKIVSIKYNSEWFADLMFDLSPIKYVHKGIDTQLYRLKSFDTYFQQEAKRAAFLQMQRYALWQEDD